MSKIFDWKNEKLKLEAHHYQDGSLSIMAFSPMQFDEDGLQPIEPCWEPYATLTVNLDCYTGMSTQDDTRAYLDENNNGRWGVVDFIKKYGLAEPTDIVVTSGFCQYRLYKWNLEKF